VLPGRKAGPLEDWLKAHPGAASDLPRPIQPLREPADDDGRCDPCHATIDDPNARRGVPGDPPDAGGFVFAALRLC
jgi:hypothetical protein